MFWTYFQTFGHSLQNLSPCQKTLDPPGVQSWLRAWLLVRYFGVCVSTVLPLRSNENLPCASWCLRIYIFSCDSSITSQHVEDVCKPNT